MILSTASEFGYIQSGTRQAELLAILETLMTQTTTIPYNRELDLRKRFGLFNGQIRTPHRHKNVIFSIVQPELQNGDIACVFGIGDLSDDDILRIGQNLRDGEMFVGWDEHHFGPFKRTKMPLIRITNSDIIFRNRIIKEEGM